MLLTPQGDIIELPFDWTMDDWPHNAHAPDFRYLMPICAQAKTKEVYMPEFDAAYEDDAPL